MSSTETPKIPSERQQTDASLHLEREKSDDELTRRSDTIAAKSDAVLARARSRAAEVLEDARDQADQTLRREGATPGMKRAVAEERAEQDAALKEENATADDERSEERAKRRRALGNLLRLEREETDDRLLNERARGDADLAARDDFMSMVSHDVRGLLGGIALVAEVQVRDAPEGEVGQQQVKSAEKIQRFTARINRLVGDLVDVASIEGGRFAIDPTLQDAATLVRESLEAFAPLAAARNISLIDRAPPGNAWARLDRDRILQVIANLLSNAIKFTGKDGTVEAGLEWHDAELVICVRDTGPGLPAEDGARVFECFWQGTKSDRRGLGLGLFISKNIIEAHQGRIWVESEVGKGSTFCFSLPSSEAPAGT